MMPASAALATTPVSTRFASPGTPSPAAQVPCGAAAGRGVEETADVVRRLYHATLLAGRALAAFAPELGEVAERAVLVRTVFSLLSQSRLLHQRLLELRTSEDDLGAPGREAVSTVQRLLDQGDSQRALSFGRLLLERLAQHYTAMLDHCEGEDRYHDRLLFQGCLGSVREGMEPYRPHPRDPVAPGPVPADPDDGRELEAYLSCRPTRGRQATPTGTVDLRVRSCPRRVYPRWSRFVDAEAVQFRDPVAGDPDRAVVVHALRKGIATEFVSTDVPMRNLCDFADLPLDFYLDMARHAHDEMRHTHLLLHHLVDLDEDYRTEEFRLPDTYAAMADQPLDFRLVVLSRTGEDAAIEVLARAVPRLKETCYVDVAMMFDHVLADELRHVAYANKWLRHLYGDDAAVERATTRCLEELNRRVDALGLGSYMRRPTDHAARRGAAGADLSLRALAGFSDYDLSRMQDAGRSASS